RGAAAVLRGAHPGGEQRPLPERRAAGGLVLHRSRPRAAGFLDSAVQPRLPARAFRRSKHGAGAAPPGGRPRLRVDESPRDERGLRHPAHASRVARSERSRGRGRAQETTVIPTLLAPEGKNRHRESAIAGPGAEPGRRERFVTVVNRVNRGLVLGSIVLLAGVLGPSPAHSQGSPAPPSAGQLDKLVAPIALYPDPLVAQILPASTYPVEVIEAERALASGARPTKATASQWDPSIQALLSYPTVLKMMSDKINWTTQLGQAVA